MFHEVGLIEMNVAKKYNSQKDLSTTAARNLEIKKIGGFPFFIWWGGSGEIDTHFLVSRRGQKLVLLVKLWLGNFSHRNLRFSAPTPKTLQKIWICQILVKKIESFV